MRRQILRTLTLRCRTDGEDTLVTFGDDNNAPTIQLTPEITTLLNAIDGESTDDEIIETVTTQHATVPRADVLTVLSQLEQLGIFEDADEVRRTAEGSQLRYDRQQLYLDLYSPEVGFGAKCQQRLHESKVLILGCGGVGSNSLLYLSNAGVGNITVIDYDKVELSNLNRSPIFDDSNLEQLKVDAIRQHRWNPDTTVNAQRRQIASYSDMADVVSSDSYDFAILAADKPYRKINEWFNEACLKTSTPNSSAGCSQRNASLGPITIPGKTACFECIQYDDTDLSAGPEVIARTNDRRTAAAFGPIIGAISGLHAHEILLHLSAARPSRLYDHQIIFDFGSFSMTAEPQLRRDDCVSCGSL